MERRELMNAPKPSHAPNVPANQLRDIEERESLESGWFVDPASSVRQPVARAKSVPPTGDDDVDAWLR
jgi:hypothetical protein